MLDLTWFYEKEMGTVTGGRDKIKIIKMRKLLHYIAESK